MDVEVAYESDIAHAKAIMKAAADEMWRENTDVLEEPAMWGVQNLNPNGVLLRLTIKTTPSQQWRISRALLERIKGRFDAEGIDFPPVVAGALAGQADGGSPTGAAPSGS